MYGHEKSPFVADGLHGCTDDLLQLAFPLKTRTGTTVLMRLVPLPLVGVFNVLGYDDSYFLKTLTENARCAPLENLHKRETFSLVKETLQTLVRLKMLTHYWQGYRLDELMPLLEAHNGQTEEDFKTFSDELEKLQIWDADDN